MGEGLWVPSAVDADQCDPVPPRSWPEKRTCPGAVLGRMRGGAEQLAEPDQGGSEIGSRRYVKLPIHMAEVIFHRLGTEEESFRRLSVARAVANRTSNL